MTSLNLRKFLFFSKRKTPQYKTKQFENFTRSDLKRVSIMCPLTWEVLTNVCPLCLSASGRYRPGKDKPDPKTWKANFRCALNSLPDVCELREHSRKRGSNAYRVYRMLPSAQTHRRRRGGTCPEKCLPHFRGTTCFRAQHSHPLLPSRRAAVQQAQRETGGSG